MSNTETKAPSYRRKDTSILPLTTFITREIYENPSNTKPLVTKSKARFFRKDGNYIYPLPTFVTVELPDQVERSDDEQAGR